MEVFSMPLQIRWSDLDPNFHLRHSVYYDWGAQCRIDYFQEKRLTPAVMQQLQFGPVILREEAVFRKEIKYGESVTINLSLIRGKRDYSRWTISHEIKKQDDILCAVVTVDGAWLNLKERKLFIPPVEVTRVFQQMPVRENVEWID